MQYEKVKDNIYRQKVKYKGYWIYRYYIRTTCFNCNKIIYTDRSNHNRKLNIKHFCSQDCKSKTYKSEKHPYRKLRKYKNGSNGGYILLFMPTHPEAKKGYVFEHRIIIEKELKRSLASNECVHHIDMDKQNNTISNLIAITKKKHNEIHSSLLPCVRTLIQKGYLVLNYKTLAYEVPNV